jgi:serine/threonine-protein kinase
VEQGIGTMLYLAECYEKRGMTASAWATFREASSRAAAANQNDRAEIGRKRAERLERALSKLTLEVPASQRVPGLELLRNGTPVNEGVWGLPLPVDPGDQRIEARAKGFASWSSVVRVAPDGANEKVTIPALTPLPPESSPVTLAPPAQGASPAAGAPDAGAVATGPSGRMSAPRVISLALGAASLALLGVGTGYGITAVVKNNHAEDHCPFDHGHGCYSTGKDLSDDAHHAARIANGTLLAGGILLVASAIVFFSAPKSSGKLRASLSLDRDARALGIGGVF